MIGIYDDSGDRLLMEYRNLEFNNAAYPVASVVIDHQYDAVTEPKAQRDGMEAYEARKLVTLVRIDGVVQGTSVADLHDKIEAMNAAFDPVLATEEDPSAYDRGYAEFQFSVPTANTDDYATGLIPMIYYGRSVQLPVPRVSKFEGHAARFTIVLQCVDPRRYFGQNSTFDIVPGPASLDNSLASYPSWPEITIEMGAAGPASFHIQNVADAEADLELDLSGLSNGDTVTIDCQTRDILVNGTRNMGLYVAGDYPRIEVGTQSVSRTTTASVVECYFLWKRAFV